jgi:hypothetical protein
MIRQLLVFPVSLPALDPRVARVRQPRCLRDSVTA